MDDLYRDYVNRVVRMTMPEQHQAQAKNIQPSAKFRLDESGKIEALPFPGYTIITPPWQDESENAEAYAGVQHFADMMSDRLPEGLVGTVPPSSYHVTLADLIWKDNYLAVSKSSDYDSKLCDRIAESFNMYEACRGTPAMCEWQILGLMIRPRAIALCLAPTSEDSYNPIIRFRRAIYQNSSLMPLGIEQQYHYTAHITLGYFTHQANTVDKAELAQTLADLHQLWLESAAPKNLRIGRAELRQFETMRNYSRQPDWPVVEL
ncbi:MAG: hypothetical protein WBA57_17940 [Elainellaceae cyanobacterium]